MHRFLRLTAFLAGVLTGAGTIVFAYSNANLTQLYWWHFRFDGVPYWTVAVVPLLGGVLIGYLYHLPARMHHFGEHMRHRHLVHEQEKELRHLRAAVDELVAAPRDELAPAQASAEVVALPRQRRRRSAVGELATSSE